MNDVELESGTGVKIHDVEAAEKRYDEDSPDNKQAAWLELSYARVRSARKSVLATS